jgi:hypothetical protein
MSRPDPQPGIGASSSRSRPGTGSLRSPRIWEWRTQRRGWRSLLSVRCQGRGARGPRSRVFIDRILKGANPASYPWSSPRLFELVVNSERPPERSGSNDPCRPCSCVARPRHRLGVPLPRLQGRESTDARSMRPGFQKPDSENQRNRLGLVGCLHRPPGCCRPRRTRRTPTRPAPRIFDERRTAPCRGSATGPSTSVDPA